MVAEDHIVVWFNNRPAFWRWDDAAEEYRFDRHLTDDERRLIEGGDADPDTLANLEAKP